MTHGFEDLYRYDLSTIEDALDDAAELLDDKLSDERADDYSDEDRLTMKSRLARYQVLGDKLKGSR